MTTRKLPLRPAALIGAAAIALFAAGPAAAQRIVTLGLGPLVTPKYPGADSYGIGVMPIIGLRRPDAPIPYDSYDDGAAFRILGSDSAFNFGPVLNIQSKREEDDVGAAVGDVGLTVEAGGFVEVFPSENFRLRADLRQGIGGHKGLLGSAGADLIVRDDQNYIFSIGPRVRWASNRYHDAYFGVDSTTAVGTGLAPFNPGSGVYAFGGIANFTHRIGRNWGLQAFGRYDRLTSDAADSPIVRTFGSRDQFSGGAGLWIEFGVGGARR